MNPQQSCRGRIWAARTDSIVSKHLAGAVAATLLVAGCTTLGPEYVAPEAPVEDAWVSEKDPHVKRVSADYSAWWTVFNDPILNSLVESARKQNLTLRIAGIRILEARAQLGIATGNQYPQVQAARAEYDRVKTSKNFNPTGLGTPPKTSYNDYSLGFDAAWELDFWGRFRRGIESADALLGATIGDYDDILVSLTAEVAATYTLIRELQERLELARNNVDLQERTLEITDVQFRGGAVSELDVQQARALLHDTLALIPDLRASLRQAQNALSVLLGMVPQELRDVLGGVKPIPLPPQEVAVGIPADLIRRRPDIRRAELEAAAQSARIGIAEADLYPTFTLTGTIGLSATSLGNLFEGDSVAGFAGPSFRWNILNYGRLKNNVRVQDARFEQLAINYQNTVLEAFNEVEDALVAFVRAQDTVYFLSESVDAARRATEISLLQYRNGLIDFIRVLDSQRFLVSQQDRLAASRGAVVRNLIATYKALGGGWETRGANEFVPAESQQRMRSRTNWGALLPANDLEEAPMSGEDARAAKTPFRAPDW